MESGSYHSSIACIGCLAILGLTKIDRNVLTRPGRSSWFQGLIMETLVRLFQTRETWS
ncbi:uncharacterized protein BDW47DRAFT_107951 [Aspergillus candidus]|uniref:Uncharacterized protein n=1 Tax=Aspergillus candidus TaxID=41067 RepID=A0A2I2F8J2_ASPCN|nr:hypothetical protein BDW47DRAFT_107951 [Aspergillus candidus]PLB36933.1 hypothetical protein BDW47DRAFT_107951 [Aspergillus candidus]